MIKVLRVGELKKILDQFDDDLPLIVTNDRKGDDFGVVAENIIIKTGAYFGNDMNAWDEFDTEDDEQQYVRLGIF